MSTNCRDSRARPFFVVTAAERITIVKNCYRLEKIKLGRRRGWLAVARTKSPGLPLRLFWCVPFCAAARPRRPSGPSAAWRRRFTRARQVAFWARTKKSAAGPATALVGAPCNKRVLRGWSRLFVASVLPLAGGRGTSSRRLARHQRAGNGSLICLSFLRSVLSLASNKLRQKCVELQLSAVREGRTSALAR